MRPGANSTESELPLGRLEALSEPHDRRRLAGHSAITSALRAAGPTLYRLNLLVLLLASFLPFPTKLVAEFIGEESPERTAVVFYGLMLLALDLPLTVFLRYAAEQRRLVREGIDDLVAEEA